MTKKETTKAEKPVKKKAPAKKKPTVSVMSDKDVRESLLKQLKAQNKTDKYYLDLVEKYMFFRQITTGLQADIAERGAVVITKSGNGFPIQRVNDSIANYNKTVATMLKLLGDLNLKEPVVETDADDYL